MEHYLDNAATTKVCPEAVSAMVSLMTEEYGNPSSTHKKGLEAERRLTLARGQVAAALGAKPEEIFFTSGGTEADNWALLRGAEAGARRGRHVITTAIEHDAILNSGRRLETLGYEVTYLKPGPGGRIEPEALAAALRPDTVLVSVMLVNNETGVIQPVAELARTVRRSGRGALVHTDAVQGFMKVPFTPAALGVDLISLSGHKIHGPKGVGALWVRAGVKLPPLLFGGGQERGQRSGTEPLPAIVGFGAAAQRAKEHFAADTARMAALRSAAALRLTEQTGAVVLPGDAPHVLSFSLPGLKSEVIMSFLESRGIYVSKGSACKRGRRSHVLTAMGLGNEIIDGAVRASLSAMTTAEDLDALCAAAAEARRTLVAAH